jgi:gamma-glutamylcysteine synthetase
VTYEAAVISRAEIPRLGLQGRLGDRPLREFAERSLDIARGGLSRRARRNEQGDDESVYLRPLAALVAAGQTPADLLLGRREPGSSIDLGALASVEVARAPRTTGS